MSIISLHDKAQIAAFTGRNPLYHIYELGDLDDYFWPLTQWYGWQKDGALQQLALLYIAQPSLPTLLANAETPVEGMRQLLRELQPLLPRRFYTHLHPDVVEALAEHYAIEPHGLHFKLGLSNAAAAQAINCDDVMPLTEADLPAIDALYKAAYPGNWFDPRNLATQAYFGIWRDDVLISIAGVHVYSEPYKVAALGNVTTLPSERGKGHALRTCAKLCQTLLARGIDQIGLNVKADNAAALSTYQRLGFEKVAEYGEYLVELRSQNEE